MTARRLAAPSGTRLDRAREIRFTFNQRSSPGFMATRWPRRCSRMACSSIGRSFKLHRPRGIYSCGVEEPTGLVDVGSGPRRTPNVRASLLEIQQGLAARERQLLAQRGLRPRRRSTIGFPHCCRRAFTTRPSNGRIGTCLSPPSDAWPDLGRASSEPRSRSLRRHRGQPRCARGRRRCRRTRGRRRRGAGRRRGPAAQRLRALGRPAWATASDARTAALIQEAQLLGVRVLTRTLAFGVYDHNLVCARQTLVNEVRSSDAPGVLRERLWKIRARAVIAAAGAFERPMVFPDNDRPGVMLAAAVEKYAHAYGVACGRRVGASQPTAIELTESPQRCADLASRCWPSPTAGRTD